MTETDYLK